eukprot:GHVO01053320.1.p1 GENE.GHVO01053320.1~~GHVO01053320.1.p1  ORF type:complete len:397 (+),score=64.35 GHVO01053320.1:40-1230(+)
MNQQRIPAPCGALLAVAASKTMLGADLNGNDNVEVPTPPSACAAVMQCGRNGHYSSSSPEDSAGITTTYTKRDDKSLVLDSAYLPKLLRDAGRTLRSTSIQRAFASRLHGRPVVVKYALGHCKATNRDVAMHRYVERNLPGDESWPCAPLAASYLDGDQPGKGILVTKQLSGPDLSKLIKREVHPDSPVACAMHQYTRLHLSYLSALRVRQLFDLNIRHNDIKPSNLLVHRYKDSERMPKLDVKLIDLGVSSFLNEQKSYGCTKLYISPELKNHKKMGTAIDARSDLWALGLTLTEVLMGIGPGRIRVEGSAWKRFIDDKRDHYFSKQSIRHVNCMPLCHKAAKYCFESLVHVNPKKREDIDSIIEQLGEWREVARNFALKEMRRAGMSTKLLNLL